jgi:hypothetical protein
MKKYIHHILVLFILILLTGIFTTCKESDPVVPEPPYGNVTFSMDHLLDSQPVKFNELIYTNAAGNNYMVLDLMYFISDITFHRNDGTRKVIGEWKDIFYVDEALPETKTIRFPDKIPAGNYDSITFVFGITEEKNQSFMFVNPPEVNMAWPGVLGGGYHYMMLNGKWKTPEATILPFDFHLGIGQLYHGSGYEVDSIYAFVQNYFTVRLPGSAFQIADKESVTFRLTMHIENWFDDPNVYDHNQWGGAIMQKQPAMQMARENGWNVFSIVKL